MPESMLLCVCALVPYALLLCCRTHVCVPRDRVRVYKYVHLCTVFGWLCVGIFAFVPIVCMRPCSHVCFHSGMLNSLLIIEISGVNKLNNVRSRGKLVLVDLAGSERLDKSGAVGSRLKEAQNINKYAFS